jgi:hypothetical protein
MGRFVRTQLFVLGCAALSGDTRDAGGAVVVGATVTAVSAGTNVARSVTTVKVEKTGFKIGVYCLPTVFSPTTGGFAR